MSHCKQEGKDRIIFMTKEDHNEPIQTRSVQELEKKDEEEGEGLILPNGEINWSCPCLGGMASGPCGVEFREAFSCFHYSEADPKGSDCIDNFRTMQECMVQYPDLYPVGEEQEKALVEETDEAGQGAPTEEVHHLSESKETTGENVLSSSEISTVGTDVVAVENGTENSKDSVGKETSEAPSGDDKLAEDESAVSDSQGESKS